MHGPAPSASRSREDAIAAGDDEGNSDAGNRRRGRQPRPVTAVSLERAAADHIARFATSAARLKRLLLRRVERVAAATGDDPAAGRDAVEALLRRLADAGLLDDDRYAQGRAVALYRRGLAPTAIRLRLRADGVDAAAIDAALAALCEETADPTLAAAVNLARRRRLGPWRPAAVRAGHRARDLAALGRAGFDPDTARRVIDADSVDELEEITEPPS